VLEATNFSKKLPKNQTEAMDIGIVVHADLSKLSKGFIKAVGQHRFWKREHFRKVPA
jgi:hypothetical protein